jgi:hypothetical protein
MERTDLKPPRRRVPLALALTALLALSGADEPPQAGATVPSDPVFTAQRLDGTTASGRIRQLGPKDEVILVPAEGPEVVIPLRRLLKLTREGASVSYSSEGALAVFPSGDRLFRCVINGANETALEVQQFAIGHLDVPFDQLLGLVLTLPPDADSLDALLERVRSEPRTSEVLWLANGDRLAGGLLGLDDAKVKLQTENGSVALDRPGVVALGFDPALVHEPRPAETYLELTMTDGSRLGVTGARVEHGQVVATSRFGASVRLALGELVAVHARTPSVSYLSDRDADRSQYVPYVGPTRPYRRNLTVEGHPFRLGGQTFERGVGTQSRTFLAYRLGGGDRRFQALVGLDDRAGPLGSVVFRVLVDGRERFVSPPMSVRDTPRPIDVDVSGAGLLVLVTEFGDRGGVRDFADWVEARLVR